MIATKKYFAPGRVNLIGEHLDYNGGLVLPVALTIGITATYTPRNDNTITLRSATHDIYRQFNLADETEFDPENDWTNYPLGVINLLLREGHAVTPADIVYESNLPEASGLSSSAALEVLTGYMLLSQTETNISREWLANFCRQVENEFIGVKCGIMDQFSVALGKAGNAILLDCHTQQYHYIPLQTGSYRLVIMNTKKPRSLIHSKYNERKAECEEALRILQTTSPSLQHLCDATISQLSLLKDQHIQKRARHVITEQLRVKESIKALRFNDLSTFGRLLNASHASLKNDYEVTGTELDTLAETAQQIKGCLGARMTGAGFGGCAIALVHKDSVDELTGRVTEKYLQVTGLTAEIYVSEIGDGVKQL